MKKIIFLIVALIVLSCSTIYAKLYNPSEGHAFDENLPFIDLQEKVLDRGGSQKRDKEGTLLFSYHKYINEILKANTITIDVKGNKLIEGYANVKEGTSKYDGTYSFKPNDPVSKGEFIKMAICLSNNRSFDYSIFTIPDSLTGTINSTSDSINSYQFTINWSSSLGKSFSIIIRIIGNDFLLIVIN